jgi:hypothetical protein
MSVSRNGSVSASDAFALARSLRGTSRPVGLRPTADTVRLVYEKLCRSDQGTDVTSVALRHGFSHLGRISDYYQSAFGSCRE